MEYREALIPGTFDPITLGHMDVIEAASKLFDHVTVAVCVNAAKTPMFEVRDRVQMVTATIAADGLENVDVKWYTEGLTADILRHGYIVRGLRLVVDYDNELQMAMANRALNNKMQTVWLPSLQEHLHISSSLVRATILNRGHTAGVLKGFLPKPVISYIRRLGQGGYFDGMKGK